MPFQKTKKKCLQTWQDSTYVNDNICKYQEHPNA
uniref:Uncharacterized protein n=1 Tax=Anguilla anguilla TaxID=7936 RepID=A0A0E9S397_ANGAN